MKKIVSVLVLIAFFSAAGLFFGSENLFAAILSSGGPNIGGQSPRYVVGHGTNTGDMSHAYIPVYKETKPTSAVTINFKDFTCYRDNASCADVQYRRQRIQVKNFSTGHIYREGIRSDTGISVPASDFTYDTDTATWKVVFDVMLVQYYNGTRYTSYDSYKNNSEICNNNQLMTDGSGRKQLCWGNRISFRVSSPSGHYVGNGIGDITKYINIISGVNAGVGRNYRIPVATPCSQTRNVQGTIYLKDLDSGTIDNNNKVLTVKIVNATTGASVGFTSSGTITDQNDIYKMTMTFEPSGAYYIVLDNVDDMNLVQYALPFPDINSTIKCGKWTIEPKTWLGTCTGNCNSNPDDTTNNRWTEYTGVASSADPFKPNIGDRVQWWHSAKNTGPSSTNYNVYWYKSYSSSGDTRSPSDDSWRRAPGLTMNSETASKLGDEIVIGQTHVGNTICNATTIWPRNQSLTGQPYSNGYYTGNQKCIYVPYNFNLVPSITIPGGNIVEPGSGTKTNITGNVKNDGPTKSRPDGKWEISKIIFNRTPTAGQKQAGDSSSPACFWSQYNSEKRSCSKTKDGTWAGTIGNGGNFSSGIEDEFTAGDEPVGITVCYVLSISPFKEGSGGWRHSGLQCITYGKKPKVQVWGGDVVVGRAIDGTPATNSDISTSLSVKRRVRTESSQKTVPATVGGASSNDISGLWKTGVDNNNAKVPANRNDTHWQVRTVFNDANKSTCAKGYRQDDSMAGPSPGANIGNVNWQAVTVGELSDKLPSWPTATNGGLVSGSSGLSNTHFATIAGDTFGAPRYIWNLARSDARWVGLNQYAHDYSSSSCVSPTKSAPGTDMTNANTTVFSLKGGINVSSEVDLDTVSFKMNLAADNLVKFFVNGKELKAASGAKMNTSHGTNWQEPGWLASSWAGATAKTVTGENAFKHGNNTFEVHVKSTYTSTGIMLYDFNFDAMKKVVVQNQVNEDVVYGSWGEYALVANGRIKGMASGAAFYPSGANSAAQGSWSKLTFANTFSTNPAGGCTAASPWGCYAHKSSMPKVEALFSTGTALGGGTIDASVDSMKNRVNTKTGGTINISAGTINVGEWAVVNAPTSTVNITGDLNYSNNTISDINNIPQMIIIANNINIAPGVTNVDSWLIAKNALATCNARGHAAQLNTTDSSYNLSSTDCNGTLRVNGPVMAKKLWLRRTAGAGVGDTTGDPAEIFNYRPDAMLWLNSRFNNKALRTTSITELPPRY